MKTKLLKIGFVLLVFGLIIFVLSVYVMEFGHTSSESAAFALTPALVLINLFTIFVGIPIFLVGIAFVMASFVTRFPSVYVVSLASIVFVVIWILFILSRFS